MAEAADTQQVPKVDIKRPAYAALVEELQTAFSDVYYQYKGSRGPGGANIISQIGELPLDQSAKAFSHAIKKRHIGGFAVIILDALSNSAENYFKDHTDGALNSETTEAVELFFKTLSTPFMQAHFSTIENAKARQLLFERATSLREKFPHLAPHMSAFTQWQEGLTPHKMTDIQRLPTARAHQWTEIPQYEQFIRAGALRDAASLKLLKIVDDDVPPAAEDFVRLQEQEREALADGVPMGRCSVKGEDVEKLRNQDSFGVKEWVVMNEDGSGTYYGLFMVADGMSDSLAGEEDSKIAVKTILTHAPTDIPQLSAAVMDAHMQVDAQRLTEDEKRGTTASVVLLKMEVGKDHKVSSAHLFGIGVGDSPVTHWSGKDNYLTKQQLNTLHNGKTKDTSHLLFAFLGRSEGIDIQALNATFEKNLNVGDIVTLDSDGAIEGKSIDHSKIIQKNQQNLQQAAETRCHFSRVKYLEALKYRSDDATELIFKVPARLDLSLYEQLPSSSAA